MIEPHLLALDEVTDGLDAVSRELMFAALDRAVAKGATLACVAHRVEHLPPCVRTYYAIEQGRLQRISSLPAPTAKLSVSNRLPAARDRVEIVVTLEEVCVVRNDIQVLTQINLTILQGEHLALTGENGAGKSTLAGVIDGTFFTLVWNRHAYGVSASAVSLGAAMPHRYPLRCVASAP